MKIKTTPDGKHAILKNGAPVYILDNGTEREIDGAAAWKLALKAHFSHSPVMASLKLPADVAESFFGESFRLEGGKLVAVDQHGIQLYSPTRHGEAADFNEAFAQLVDRYENKGMIQRETGTAPVKGAAPASQPLTGRAIPRSQFDALTPHGRAQFLKDGGRVGDAASGSAPAPAPALAPASQPAAGKTMTRAQFDSTNPMQLAVFFKSGGKLVD